jgi:hypothetical protein
MSDVTVVVVTGAASPSHTARPSEEDYKRQFILALYPEPFTSTTAWNVVTASQSNGSHMAESFVNSWVFYCPECRDSPPRLVLTWPWSQARLNNVLGRCCPEKTNLRLLPANPRLLSTTPHPFQLIRRSVNPSDSLTYRSHSHLFLIPMVTDARGGLTRSSRC